MTRIVLVIIILAVTAGDTAADMPPGFQVPLRCSPTEPILMSGLARTVPVASSGSASAAETSVPK